MSGLLPPTSRLPPICKISSSSCAILLDALEYLRSIYVPEVRGSRRHCITDTNGNGKHSDSESYMSDTFEKAHAIRWLTCVISQSDHSWRDEGDDETLTTASVRQRERILEEAASLLAIYAGTASAGTFTRIFSFGSQQSVSESDVGRFHFQVQLGDAPLENHDFTSVGAQTWGSACVLADMIVDDPKAFGLQSESTAEGDEVMRDELRVLELGAGTGLVSLTVGKLLDVLRGWRTRWRRASVFATDFHPSVLKNLQSNVSLNFPGREMEPGSEGRVSVESHHMDWSEVCVRSDLVRPFDEPFDLILGMLA
jgi:hypothetical protein